MTAMENLGTEIRTRGWRAGSVMPLELAASHRIGLQRPVESADSIDLSCAWPVVITQTCDLYARTLSQEPLVEVLICTPIAKARKGFRRLESTRQLDFVANRAEHPGVTLTAHATRDRCLVSREILAQGSPDTSRSLSTRAVELIQRWYALRYSRPAWPNELVDRLDPQKERMLEALAPLSDDRTEIRVRIMPPRVPNDDFQLLVLLVLDEDLWGGGSESRKVAARAFNEFLAALRSCPGVRVDDESKPVNGAEFTWQEARDMDVWNFAQLSAPE